MVFIIAECGVNWRDLVDADDMIREAAAAGAAACKFQAYRVDEMELKREGDRRLIPHLASIQLNESTIQYLYWRCQQHGVEFMCTPMYPEAVPMLDPYVKRWKIRYKDQDNEAILVPCRATGKPMLISGKNVFCIPEYPPAVSPIPPAGFDGYSCHVPFWEDMRAPLFSDLRYLEVHVRLDRYVPHWCPPDTTVSLTMTELAELCRGINK